MTLLKELRHRQVFQLVGLYVVGAWVFIEVSSVFFPAWEIPDTSLRYLFIGAALLFPLVVLFGWSFDVRRDGVFRTVKTGSDEIRAVSLRRRDYAALAGLTILSAAVLLVTLVQVWNSVGDVPEPVSKAVDRLDNSVAVLPFKNLDPNPDTGYFSDGVSEEILHRLSSIRALHVLGWASARIIGQSEIAPADISERLGVEYLLHGSIRRDGEFVRVTARLMDQTGLQVWSQTFDRKLEGIFVIQSEIASIVASQIVAEIVSSGGTSVLRATSNMDAYNEYLVGRALTHARGPNWDLQSEAAFRRAIELDPEFAPAYAGLAYSLIIMSDASEERLKKALAAAQQSLELDPDLALGHAMIGVMQGAQRLASLEEAEQRLRRALELDPALSDAYNWLSINLRNQGRLKEANIVSEQVYQIDPLHPSIAGNFANQLANYGDYERAMRTLEPFTRLPQMGGAVIAAFVTINRAYGRYAEAIGYDTAMRCASCWEALGFTDRADDLAARINDTVIRVELLHSRGEHLRAQELVASDLAEHGDVFEELGPNSQAWILVTQVLAGDYHGAIERFESLGDFKPLAWIQLVDGLAVADLLNALGFAYLQTGDSEKAASVLSVEPPRLALWKPWSSPTSLAPMALNAALRGDDDLAFERLSRAVDLGWANYYMTINDPRWGDTLSQPRFVELLEGVKADIAQQRAEVEAMLASQSKS
jgi:TolB-like protein/tetratricopeptide (TPR) repeat protein